MKKRFFILFTAFSMAMLLATAPALAHKVKVFAYVEAGRLIGEGYMSGGGKAQNCLIEVRDVSGRMISQGKTNAQGKFSLPLPQGRPPFRLILKAGEGHQAEFTLEAQDLGLKNVSAAASKKQPAPTELKTTPLPAISPAELERVLNQVMDRKLAPLKAQINHLAARDNISLKDIIGGLGWIMGLMGLAAYLKKRKDS